MHVKTAVLIMALALAATPLAIAQGPPDDGPGGPPDDTPQDPPTSPPDEYPPEEPPQGPPEEYPGPGDFPADPSEHFPDHACEYTPDRPGGVPGWVVIPFENCGDDEEEEGEGGESAPQSAPRVPILP